MTDLNRDHHWEQGDTDYRTGAVEDGGDDMIDEQILPVWATTEPFGYEGDASDLQFVRGDDVRVSLDKGRARRDIIGPGSS